VKKKTWWLTLKIWTVDLCFYRYLAVKSRDFLRFILPFGDLDFWDSQHAGTAFADAIGDCTPAFDPEFFLATSGSESLLSPNNLPSASASQSPFQTLATSSSQTPTEPPLPRTAEDILNGTPK
jgi:hypothetical protein